MKIAGGNRRSESLHLVRAVRSSGGLALPMFTGIEQHLLLLAGYRDVRSEPSVDSAVPGNLIDLILDSDESRVIANRGGS